MAKIQEHASQNMDKQGRKKQAKHEAKMMLKIEQAKKDVQKAEQKVARTQANLEESRTLLQDLERQLNEARAAEQPASSQDGHTAQNAQNNGTSSQEQFPTIISTPQADSEAIEAFHTASIIPSEGREDIVTASATEQTVAEEQSAQQVVNAEVSSSFEPAEGREDISVNGETASSSSTGEPLTEAESDVTSEPSNESPDTTSQTDKHEEGSVSSEDETPQHTSEEEEESHNKSNSSIQEETLTASTRRRKSPRRTHSAAEKTGEESQ